MENHESLTYELDQPLDVVGAATSDWQLNPVKCDGTDDRSDWGAELVKKNLGGPTGIKGSSKPEELPRFHEKYDKITDRLKETNANTFRLSLDFGRLCPNEGVFDEQLMAHYIRVLANCKSKGIEPMITLHHWTAPSSFATYDKKGRIKTGPLEHPDIVSHFNFYVDRVADFLCDPNKIRSAVAEEGYDQQFIQSLCDEKLLAKWFITINEPVNLLFTPYMIGEFPPYQKASVFKYPKLLKKVKSMHDQAYDIIHEAAAQNWTGGAHAKVGYAHNVAQKSLLTQAIGYEKYANWDLVDAMEDGSQSDIFGLQYYFRIKLGLKGLLPGIAGSDPNYQSDHPQFGQIYAPGIEEVLKYANQKFPGKEIMVTEFGFADKQDNRRPSWMMDTAGHILKAKKEGVPVNGMLAWSIMNNFEWAQGMNTPFGIYDTNGDRLQSDDERPGHISSRHVWTQLSKHLRAPTKESAQEMQKLQEAAYQQLKNSTAIQKV